MIGQIWRTDLKLVPDTYITLNINEIGFLKKRELYFAKFFFKGKHYLTVEASDMDDQDDIRNFCHHYKTIFQIADRPFFDFSKKECDEALYQFVKSSLFQDIWFNLGEGYGINFQDLGRDFILSNGSQILIESQKDTCKIFLDRPKILSEDSYKSYEVTVPRIYGELILAIIREYVVQVGRIGYNKEEPFITKSLLNNTCQRLWSAESANGHFFNIMDYIYQYGNYKDLHKK